MRIKLHIKGLSLLLFLFILASPMVYGSENRHYSAIERRVLQDIKSHKVTLIFKNSTLKTILNEINRQTKLQFAFKDKLESEKLNSLTISVKDITVETVLNQLLKDSGYSYKIVSNTIIIEKIEQEEPETKANSTIKAVVVTPDGEPIPGVTVISAKDNTRGAITNMNGEFIIVVTQGETLELSCIGMKPTLLRTPELPYYETVVKMKYDEFILDDVLVTGYGVINSHENVGAITKIYGEDLNINANQNVTQMLQGKIAGLVVTNHSGAVGMRQSVKVRGTSTLLGNQEPVWVVDGIIQEDPIPFDQQQFNAFGAINEDNQDMIRNFVGGAISWLNPNDIDEITVLKDASATAIYGVKAANGVIVITTKRGEVGNAKISYSANISFSEKTNYDKLNIMNSQERTAITREILSNGYWLGSSLSDYGYEGAYKKYMNREISYEEFNILAKEAELVNTDWLDHLMRNPISHSHSVSISGGSERTSYYGSIGANVNQGQAYDNEVEGYTASININTWIVPEKLSFSTRISGSYTNTSGFVVDPYRYAIETSRTIPIYTEDGSPYYYVPEGSGFLYNFENERDNTSNSNTKTQLTGSFSLVYRALKGLDLSANVGYGVSTSMGSIYKTEMTHSMTEIRLYEYGEHTPSDAEYKYSPLPHGGEYSYNESSNFNYTARIQAAYNKVLYINHRINAMLGYEIRSTSYNGFNHLQYGYLPSRGHTFIMPPTELDLGAAGTMENSIFDKYVNEIEDRIVNNLSIFATTGYSYKEKYILSVTVRSDASNRFGQDRNARFLPVFSVGGRWNVAEEDWMDNQNIVNNLSLRASYGWQGNVAENFGPDLIANIGGIESFTGEYTLKIKSLPYTDLRWEKVKTYNIGVDFGLFKNKVQFSFNYYNKVTDDMIVYLNVPYSFGIESMPVNGGTMRNSGWDLTLSTTPIRTHNFIWNVSFNTAVNKNKLTSGLEKRSDWLAMASGEVPVEGYPYSAVWAFDYAGVDPEDGSPMFNFPDRDDLNYDPADASTFMTYVGTLEPIVSGGLSTSFMYKKLSLAMSFTASIGGVRYLSNYINVYDLPSGYQNMSRDLLTRWSVPGDELRADVTPSYPKKGSSEVTILPDANATELSIYEMYNYSTARLVDASFLKCSSITLGYTFPHELLKGISSMTINAGVSNPFQIVSKDFKGIDPEVATGNMPILKSYNIGLSITF